MISAILCRFEKTAPLKLFLTLLISLFTFALSLAQVKPDTAATDIALTADTTNIIDGTQIFIDSSDALSPEQALQKKFFPLADFKKRRGIPPDMIPYAYFLKFNVVNSADTALAVYLYPGALYEKINLYRIIELGGGNEKTSQVTDVGKKPGFKKITLGPGERTTILVYMKFVKNETAFIATHLVSSKFIENYRLIMLSSRPEIRIFGYVLSGVLLMMILFMGTNFILSRRLEFQYNFLYSSCMFLLIFFNSYTLRTLTPFSNFFLSYFDFFLLVTGTIFYILFTRSFLNTRVKYVFLDKVLKYGEVFIFAVLIVYSYLNFFTHGYVPQFLLENVMKFMILGLGVFFIILALQQRNRLLNYIAAGNAALVVFSAISLGLIWQDGKVTGLFDSPIFYYNMGIVSELIFFLLGLTYKNRSETIERIKEQEAMKMDAEKKEFESQIAIIKAQQEERNRISADMHDDLGAGMTTIRLYSELAKNKLLANPMPEIDKISSSSNELLNKMNAIIWSMSSSNDSLGNLTAYIRSYALEYFEGTGVDCRISIPDDLPNIEVIGEIRRNVFLVVKEALNNILKHARASRVIITLERVPGGLTLYIQDNGVGIDFDKLRQFSNGLNNMKKRMKDVNIDFCIENKNGTLITMHRKVEDF